MQRLHDKTIMNIFANKEAPKILASIIIPLNKSDLQMVRLPLIVLINS